MRNNIPEKLCPRCNKVGPFSKDRSRVDGLNRVCKVCQKEVARTRSKTTDNVYFQDYRAKLKAEVVTHYGGECAGCGETDLVVLTIDHINGGGNEHRKQIGSPGGFHFYTWLRKNGYPAGYRVLCMNCQFRAHKGVLNAS